MQSECSTILAPMESDSKERDLHTKNPRIVAKKAPKDWWMGILL